MPDLIDLEPLSTPILVENRVVNFYHTANFPWARWFGQIRAALNGPTPVPFVGLPTRPTIGLTAIITDSSVATPGAIVTGGGSATVLIWWNGVNWTVIGT